MIALKAGFVKFLLLLKFKSKASFCFTAGKIMKSGHMKHQEVLS